MLIRLKDKILENSLFTVPEFNFGQLQRWKGKERLSYSLELESSVFISKIEKMFASFRENEILENDTFDLEELIAYEKAGRPTLLELFDKDIALLKILIIYHSYDILHLIIEQQTVGKLFYSINSLDEVLLIDNKIVLKGICFEIRRD